MVYASSISDKGSVFSFNIKGVHAHDASTVFDEDDIAVRAGHHCCQILHKKMKIGSSLRVSFGVYNNKQDIDALCESIKKCKKIFKLNNIPIIDVTRKSVEETAASIIKIHEIKNS